jgi:hypothetical protein
MESLSSQYKFKCQFQPEQGTWEKAVSLIDTGASACFVSAKLVKRYCLKLYKISTPMKLALANGDIVGQLSQAVDLPVRHGSHTSTVMCYVANVSYDVILGMNWMDHHAPVASFGKTRSLHFNSQLCIYNCCRHALPETVYNDRPPDSATRRHPGTRIDIITARAALMMARRDPNRVSWIQPHEWEGLDPLRTEEEACRLDVAKVVEYWRDLRDDPDKQAHLASATEADFMKYLEKMEQPLKSREDIITLLPKFLHSRWQGFNPQQADKLPQRRAGVDHAIDLNPEAPIPRPKIYGLTRKETEAVKVYLDDMLGKGFIRASTSPYAAPVLVVRKPQGGLRICVDYRALNSLTRKNRNAPPAIRETLARMNKVSIMSIVDVIAAFNMVRIKEGDEEKTAFLTRYGLYEYLVMPFGLCNAPGTFQNFINNVLREYLDIFCSAYIDDVLIYSEREEDHEKHVLAVVDKLIANGLYMDVTKCKFNTRRVKYLGLIVTTEGIEMDPAKVQAVKDWKKPTCVKDVQAFLGFANFYRRFILGFSAIAKPLTELTKNPKEGKASPFPLPDKHPAVEAFEKLKQAFTVAPVLAHFDPDKQCWLETDASDFVYAAILSQMDDKGNLRPIAFMSHKMNPAECNYMIYDKELLAIVRAFEEWRFELSGTDGVIQVLTDHQALQYFMTSKRLNRRQARWAEFLAEFNFLVKYRSGRQGTKPDALTRRPGDLLENADDERRRYQLQTILKPHQVERYNEYAFIPS